MIKTPIPTLILLLAAVHLSTKDRPLSSPAKLRRDAGSPAKLRRDAGSHAHFLLVPAAFLFASSMFSSIDIGYRNILPVLPFVHVYVSQVARRATGRLARGAVVLLGVWYALGTALLSPHYLAYFNELVGGPANGYKYLVDSNLDWGQDLKHLKQYVESQGLSEVYLSYFGTADPSYYGIDHLPMPERPPAATDEPAYYVISATSLQGVYAAGASGAHWLADYAPHDRVGYSMFVYRLP
jgi:hypothetical protein